MQTYPVGILGTVYHIFYLRIFRRRQENRMNRLIAILMTTRIPLIHSRISPNRLVSAYQEWVIQWRMFRKSKRSINHSNCMRSSPWTLADSFCPLIKVERFSWSISFSSTFWSFWWATVAVRSPMHYSHSVVTLQNGSCWFSGPRRISNLFRQVRISHIVHSSTSWYLDSANIWPVCTERKTSTWIMCMAPEVAKPFHRIDRHFLNL